LELTAWSWRAPWILVSLSAMAIMMALGIGVAAQRRRQWARRRNGG
jgi:hypothetical protein